MIDFIDGSLAYIEHDYIVIDTGGVGYQLFCGQPLQFANEEGNRLRVYTHQTVREDFIGLYGFITREERDLFRRLLDVSGIGPKGALGVIASGKPQQVVAAIQQEDITFLTKFPGIGKKTAQRMVLDLKDKLNGIQLGSTMPPTITTQVRGKGPVSEAFEALIALGYNEREVKDAFSIASEEIKEDMAVDAVIKKVLQVFLKR